MYSSCMWKLPYIRMYTVSAGQRALPDHHSFCYNDYSTRHSTHPGTQPNSASHKINKAATLRHKAYNVLNYSTADTSHQHHDSDLIAQEDVLHFQPSTTGTSHSRQPTTISATEHPVQPTHIRKTTDHHPQGWPNTRTWVQDLHTRKCTSSNVLFIVHWLMLKGISSLGVFTLCTYCIPICLVCIVASFKLSCV